MGASPTKQSVYCVSDIHTDHSENWNIILKLADKKHLFDEAALICAGDISTDLDLLRETLEFLKTIFPHVFFCPGNNELRLSKHDRKKFANSIEKFHSVLNLCEEIESLRSVDSAPVCVVLCAYPDSVLILDRYTPYFSSSYEGDQSYRRCWLDFRTCSWPEGMDDEKGAAQYMLAQNEKALSRTFDAPVITYSHFLPRLECLPTITSAFMKESLPLVIGCPELDGQIRKLKSTTHVFGHTHLNIDRTVDGVRYVQNAFGHPTERKGLNLQQLTESLKCIHSAPS